MISVFLYNTGALVFWTIIPSSSLVDAHNSHSKHNAVSASDFFLVWKEGL
jgi:hypothetical protein